MDITPYIQEFHDYVERCLEGEQDAYKKALLIRIHSNAEAINYLIEGGFWIEAPVLLRVSFEHTCRLYLVNKDPGAFSDPKHFKLMGKTDSPKKAIDDFGIEFQIVYEALCSFAHPDMMSMILNQNPSPQNKLTCEIIMSISVLVNIVILFNVYPNVKDFDTARLIQNQLLRLMPLMGNEFLNYLGQADSAIEELENVFEVNPSMKQPFKRDEMNKALNTFLQKSKNGELEEFILEQIHSLTGET